MPALSVEQCWKTEAPEAFEKAADSKIGFVTEVLGDPTQLVGGNILKSY